MLPSITFILLLTSTLPVATTILMCIRMKRVASMKSRRVWSTGRFVGGWWIAVQRTTGTTQWHTTPTQSRTRNLNILLAPQKHRWARVVFNTKHVNTWRCYSLSFSHTSKHVPPHTHIYRGIGRRWSRIDAWAFSDLCVYDEMVLGWVYIYSGDVWKLHVHRKMRIPHFH